MPKIWLAIFFGYNGSTFSGMQYQMESHTRTIEGLLIEKLKLAGFISTTQANHLQKNERWSRAARTDKGVHAVINGISCLFSLDTSMFLQDGTLNRDKVDLELKQAFEGTQIVYHCFKRVTNRFQIRHMVKSRHYSYVCPKKLFLRQPQQNTEPKEGIRSQQNKQILKKINECCSLFVGTHNFHNYSKNLRAKDAQAQRYIIEFKANQLNHQYLCFDIIGQSFIYHQIRKMIGCIIMVMANNYPPQFITNTFFKNQIKMPIAPPQGLYLYSMNFGAYNRKKDIPQKLQFQGLQSAARVKKQIEEFILGLNMDEWMSWFEELKKSIFFGVELLEDDEDGANDE